MEITNLFSSWGSKITVDDPQEILLQPKGFWRDLMYSRKFLLFKKIDWSKEDYVRFVSRFGHIWQDIDYLVSREHREVIVIDNKEYIISPISNKSSPRLAMLSMPYHADIPNNLNNPFPMRSLWLVDNPNPESGLTGFLNIEDAIDLLPTDLKEQIPQIKIIQQSWHIENKDIREFDFIKIHPVTGKASLRINYYNDTENNVTEAWIKSVLLNGQAVEPKLVLDPYIKFFETLPDMMYVHKWDTNDILIYDNWSFIHNRTNLSFNPDLERKFYRANIDHLKTIDSLQEI